MIPLISKNNVFSYCQNAYEGGVFRLSRSELQDFNSTYSNNSAAQGGAIYCYRCRLNITESNFTNLLALEGSAFYIKEYDPTLQSTFGQQLWFNSSMSLQSKVDLNQNCGGTITFDEDETDKNELQLRIANIKAYNLSTNIAGAFVCSKQSLLNLEIDGISVHKTQSEISGGMFLMNQIFSITIKNSIFKNFEAFTLGSFMAVMYQDYTVKLINNTFIQKYNELDEESQILIQVPVGMFYLPYSKVVISTNNKYQKIEQAIKCGVFQLIYGNFQELGSVYEDITVQNQGGAICLDQTSAKILNTLFQRITATDGGALVILNQNTLLEVYDSKFSEILVSNQGGIAYFSKEQFLLQLQKQIQLFQNCTFENITTLKRASGFYFNDFIFEAVRIISCKFSRMQGEQTGIFDINQGSGQIIIERDQNIGESIFQDFLAYDLIDASSSLYYSNSEYVSLQLTDTLIQCSTFSSSSLLVSQLKRLVGAIKIASSQQGIKSIRNIFRNCLNVTEGAIFYIQDSILVEDSSDFYNNSADNGGILGCTGCNAQLSNSNLHDNFAQAGGLFVLFESYDIVITDVIMTKITATKKGGVFFVNQIQEFSNWKNNILIQNCHNIDFISAQEGGFLYSQSFDLNLTINNSTFLDIHASSNGGLFSINKGFSFHLKDVFIDRVTSLKSQLVTSIAPLKNFSLENCNIICDINYNGDSSQELDRIDPQYSKVGVFNFLNAEGIYIFNSKFQKCASQNEGGVFQLSKVTYFYDFQSKYIQNSAIFGGVFHISQSGVYLHKSEFQDNQAFRGGCIQIGYDSFLQINSVKFSNNKAYSQAGVIMLTLDQKKILDSNFRGNGNLNVKGYSNRGSFIFISLDVKLYIKNSYFTRGYAIQGGAIYISGDSQIVIVKSSFIENQASKLGGAIYAEGFSALNITGDSKILNNLAGNADDIYVANSDGIFSLDQVLFDNPGARGSLIVNDVQVYFNNVIMRNIGLKQVEKQQGAGMICYNCLKVKIFSSTFENIHSSLGGALMISMIDLRKTGDLELTDYHIKDSTFKNNEGIAGGSLYLDNIYGMLIDNSTFLQNKAVVTNNENFKLTNGSGGAIYFDCNQYTLKCQLTISNKSKFQGNIAQIQGGVLHWTNIEPIVDKSVIFEKNFAFIYGNNISCFAQNLIKIDKIKYDTIKRIFSSESQLRILQLVVSSQETIEQLRENQKSFDTMSNIPKQQSGGEIQPFYLALMDKYNQIVTADSTNKIRLVINVTNSQNYRYPPIIEGDSTFYLSYGLAEIKDIAFAGTPGANYSISLLTEAIDKTKKSNQQYMISQAIDQIDFKLEISLRECEVGEQFTSGGKCVQCPDGLSFSLIKMDEPGNCQSCPTAKAICYGGTNIGPKLGYWRKNNQTSNFVRCLNSQSCLGMIPPENNPIGTCLKGYQGVLCQDCEFGYSRTDNNYCSKCPEPYLNILRLFAVFLLAVMIVTFLIRSTLNGAKDKRNITSVYLKILMNHLQVIVLTAQFDFKWPDQVKEFYDGVRPVAQSSNQIISVDCFLDKEFKGANLAQDRAFFQKLVILSVSPLMMVLLVVAFWKIYFAVTKRSSSQETGKIVASTIILLFLAHPNIVQYMFNNFRCLNIDGDDRVENDLEVMCWSYFHNYISYFIAAPSILVWGIGIPFFALIILVKFKSKLDQKFFRERNYGVVAQALIVLIFYIIFLLITTKLHPFSNLNLNELESLSLITSMLTIYCGLYFITDIPEQWIKNEPELKNFLILTTELKLFFFSVIIIGNLVFFTHWIQKMFGELQFKLMSKLPKLYIFLCMCNNSYKFNQQLNQLRIKDENDNLHDEFDRTLRQLKEIYSNGKLMLNQKSVEKLQVILNPDHLLKQLSKAKTIDEQQVQSSQVQVPEKKQLRRQRQRNINRILNETFIEKNLISSDISQKDSSPITTSFNESSSFQKQQMYSSLQKLHYLSTDKCNEESKTFDTRNFLQISKDLKDMRIADSTHKLLVNQDQSIEFESDQCEVKDIVKVTKNLKRVNQFKTSDINVLPQNQKLKAQSNTDVIKSYGIEFPMMQLNIPDKQHESPFKGQEKMISKYQEKINRIQLIRGSPQKQAEIILANQSISQKGFHPKLDDDLGNLIIPNFQKILDESDYTEDESERDQNIIILHQSLKEMANDQNIVIKPRKQSTKKIKESFKKKNTSNQSFLRELSIYEQSKDSFDTSSLRLRESQTLKSKNLPLGKKVTLKQQDELIEITNSIEYQSKMQLSETQTQKMALEVSIANPQNESNQLLNDLLVQDIADEQQASNLELEKVGFFQQNKYGTLILSDNSVSSLNSIDIENQINSHSVKDNNEGEEFQNKDQQQQVK